MTRTCVRVGSLRWRGQRNLLGRNGWPSGGLRALCRKGTPRGGRHPEIAAITLQTPKPSRIAAPIRCTQAIGITFRLHAPRVTARAATVQRLSLIYKMESTKTVPPAAGMSSGFDRAVRLDHVGDLERPLGLAGTFWRRRRRRTWRGSRSRQWRGPVRSSIYIRAPLSPQQTRGSCASGPHARDGLGDLP
jgi:hypothetical protein